MFRIPQVLKITSVARKSFCSRPTFKHPNTILKCRIISLQRLYSSDKKDDGDKGGGDKKGKPFRPPCPPKDSEKCSTEVPGGPCAPPKKKIPPLNECNKPNLMSECPQPVCPWESEAKKEKKSNRTILLLGLLFTALTLGMIYYIGFFNKPEVVEAVQEKKKKKRKPFKKPLHSAEIPPNVPYLLIGGGTASFSAFRAIKSADPTAKVLVISNEEHFPYMRPPLSKEMWFNDDKDAVKNLIFKQWNGSERSLYYEPNDFYTECKNLMESPNGGVAVALGWSVSRIDPCSKTVYLEDDYEIQYDKCLIATGAKPKKLSVFEVASNDPVIEEKCKTFRNVYDFEDVLDTFEESKTVAVVGGGFLGSELACALARKGKDRRVIVYQIFREDGNMGKILPEYLSYWTTEKVKSEGVSVLPNTEVLAVKVEGQDMILTLTDGQHLKVDQAVVAVGVEPNTEFAESADLEVDPELGGYLVNTELMARSNLYVAGDCACFYDAKLGRRRIEHHDHAVVSGRLAGENMAGGCNTYVHQSMFWSDLGPDVGYEAIGIIDSSLPTVGVFAKATDKDNPMAVVTATNEGIRSKTEEVPEECKKFMEEESEEEQKKRKERSKPQTGKGEDFGKGVVFYLRDDIVVGIVLWNVFNRMSIARQVLKDEKKYDDLNEVAKLFNIHEE